jgi:RimJ/RimL family protein N-acetyltransferase
MKLETKRLNIRWMNEGDAPFILKLLNDPTYISMIRDTFVRDIAGAADYIREKYIKSYEANGYGLYLIETKASMPVGICGIINRGLDVPDIGFAVLKEHAGNGYTTEAAKKVLEHARTELQLNKISAITTEENVASTKVIKNLGFTFIKILTLPDADKELNYFEIEGEKIC